MPRITDIQVQKNNKNRVNIYVDGEFLRGAEAISVVRNGLKTGMEISEERLREALADSERESAFAKAVEYLSRAMRTEEQLKKFLLSKGYDSDTVDSVADKLREYGYIDDARYARLYAEQFGKTRGKKHIARIDGEKEIRRRLENFPVEEPAFKNVTRSRYSRNRHFFPFPVTARPLQNARSGRQASQFEIVTLFHENGPQDRVAHSPETFFQPHARKVSIRIVPTGKLVTRIGRGLQENFFKVRVSGLRQTCAGIAQARFPARRRLHMRHGTPAERPARRLSCERRRAGSVCHYDAADYSSSFTA